MAWLVENWFWILTFIAFVAMHMFGHGGDGGHGDHRGHREPRSDRMRKPEDRETDGPKAREDATQSVRHPH